jgi:hypothetical protein
MRHTCITHLASDELGDCARVRCEQHALLQRPAAEAARGGRRGLQPLVVGGLAVVRGLEPAQPRRCLLARRLHVRMCTNEQAIWCLSESMARLGRTDKPRQDDTTRHDAMRLQPGLANVDADDETHGCHLQLPVQLRMHGRRARRALHEPRSERRVRQP